MIRLLIVALLLSSCSAAWHFKRFERKGGKIEPIKHIDSIPYAVKGKDGKDSLIYIPVEIDCPEVTAPETNAQTRQEEKTKRLEVKETEKTKRTEVKQVEKTTRVVQVKSCTPIWKIVLLCLGSLLLGYFFRFLVGIFNIPFGYKK